MIFTGVALRRADVPDAAVAMIVVVPAHKLSCPGPGLVKVGEALGGELGAVLGRSEQGLGIGVVVAHAWPGVRGFDAQMVEHGQHRGGLERGAVVAVQHGLAGQHGNALGQSRALHQMRGVVGVVRGVHFPAYDLATVEVQDQVQVEPAPDDGCGQIGHVPTPDLARGRGDVRGRWTRGLGCLGPATVGVLPVLAQHPAEAGLASQVHAFVGQHGYDARRRHTGKAWQVGHRQELRTLIWRQGVAELGAHGLRPAIARCEPCMSLPTLQGAQINAGDLTCWTQPRTVGAGNLDVLGHGVAIFEGDHSSSPLWKIASSFFDSTSKAAVSARAAFLRRRSRSSSLMRLWSCLVAWGLARASSGSDKAVVQLTRQRAKSAWYTPCSRHQALLSASLIEAVVITASSRAPAVQARPRDGLARASACHLPSVPMAMPLSRETTSNAALSGGNNLATVLSLNACPYRATEILHRHPLIVEFYRHDNYSDAAGS